MAAAVSSQLLSLHSAKTSRRGSLSPSRSSARATLRRRSTAASLSATSLSPHIPGSAHSDFAVPKIGAPSRASSRHKRNVVVMVIPTRSGPPDIASYLFYNRIVYLGMPIFSAVTELITAEFMYLQYDNDVKPIYMYINSIGTTRGDTKFGAEVEAFTIHDIMRIVTPTIYTLCVGNAWGEAALLLAAGTRGCRAALPSATIMIKQPIDRFQGQAATVDGYRKDIRTSKAILVRLYARYMRKTTKQIEEDIARPKYFSPSEAVDYGIIDRVLHVEKAKEEDPDLLDDSRSKDLFF